MDSALNSISPLSFMELALQQVVMIYEDAVYLIFYIFYIGIFISSSILVIIVQAKYALENLEVPVGYVNSDHNRVNMRPLFF